MTEILIRKSARAAANAGLPLRLAVAMFEADYMVACYLLAGRNMDKTAKIAGLSSRSYAYRLMKHRGVWPWKAEEEL